MFAEDLRGKKLPSPKPPITRSPPLKLKLTMMPLLPLPLVEEEVFRLSSLPSGVSIWKAAPWASATRLAAVRRRTGCRFCKLRTRNILGKR